MQIRIRATGAVVFQNEFRAYAQTQGAVFGASLTEEFINQYGGDIVFEGPQAQPTRYQVAFRDGVEQVEGKWYTKYSVADLDTEGIAAKDAEQAKSVRTQRGEKLKDSDWTQVADAPVDKAAWAAHRQALRDITAQAGFPWAIDWPEQP